MSDLQAQLVSTEAELKVARRDAEALRNSMAQNQSSIGRLTLELGLSVSNSILILIGGEFNKFIFVFILIIILFKLYYYIIVF